LPGIVLPKLYAAFVTWYAFEAFEMRAVEFLGTVGDPAFPSTALRDTGLFRGLQAGGWMQVGRPATGSYDPICLEQGGDRLLRIDHEAILTRGHVRKKDVDVIAEEFGLFVEAALISREQKEEVQGRNKR
jgi:hypothetical protein